MSGALIELDAGDLDRLQSAMDRLIDAAASPRALLTQLASGVESQTRRRIGEDKSAPEGSAWQAWSQRYAATRGPGKRLLQSEGDLLDSIDSQVDGDTAEIGSNLVYAATHQFGDDERGIPARPYLGLSRADVDALERLTENWAEALLQ